MSAEWRQVRLGEIGGLKNGINFSKEDMGNGLRVINVKDLFSDALGIRFDALDRVNVGGRRGIENFRVRSGDLFFVRSSVKREGIGVVGLAERDDDTTVHCGFVIRFRLLDGDVDPRFLAYELSSPDYRKRIVALSGGSAITNISQQNLALLPLELPNLAVQRTIVGVLSAYDDLIENNTRRIAILEEMARALYREWFVDFRFPGHEGVAMVESEMGPVPDGWEVGSFADIVEVRSGGTPRTTTPEYWSGTIPFFTPRDVPLASYVLDTEKQISDLGLRACNSRLYPKDTVFITARGSVGNLAMAGSDMAMNQSCYALLGRSGIDQKFVFLAIQEKADRLRQSATGAVFDTIVVDTFDRLLTVRPPLELVHRFGELATPIFDQILNTLRRNANLRRTRDLLLPRLVSGELDLERIDDSGVQDLTYANA